jgi:hypothetical protein
MPTTFLGLAIFVAFLIPGFLQAGQRRLRMVPNDERKLSPLAETISIATVSLFTGLIALALFALARIFLPHHSPEIRRLFGEGGDYAYPRLGYLGLWAFAAFAVSCTAAFVIGVQPRWLRRLSRFTPLVVETSLWYQVLDNDVPEDTRPYVGCDLRDGGYVAGFVDWFNVDSAETGDRDLVLSGPIIYKQSTSDNESKQLDDVARVVVSARDIVRMFVSYVGDGDDSIPEQTEPDAPASV